MIIRILLIGLICLLFLWFLRQRTSMRSQAWSKVIALLLFAFAVFAILSPDTANALAHRVGVGRGADLMLYALAVAFMGALLRYYMHRQADSAKIVRITRRLAILEANQHPHNAPLHATRSTK